MGSNFFDSSRKYQIYFYVMLSIFVDKNKATNNFSFI